MPTSSTINRMCNLLLAVARLADSTRSIYPPFGILRGHSCRGTRDWYNPLAGVFLEWREQSPPHLRQTGKKLDWLRKTDGRWTMLNDDLLCICAIVGHSLKWTICFMKELNRCR
jgi:hypothetical protein